MGIFSQKPKFKVTAPTVRVEKVLVDKPKPQPKPLSSKSLSAAAAVNGRLRASASPRPSPLGSAGGGRNKSKSASPLPSGSSADEQRRLTERKRKLVAATARPAAGGERVKFDEDDSGDDDDDGWRDALGDHKRRRRGGPEGEAPVDLERSLRHPDAFAPDGKEEKGGAKESDVAIIHAADVASLALGCAPALRLPVDAVAVELQYPGGRQRERYELVKGKDKIDAVSDIIEVVKRVADNYLADEDSKPFMDSNTGFIRQLERASSPNVCDAAAFKSVLREYNDRVLALQKNGSIAKVLDQKHGVPLDLVQLILRQVYDRTVALKVELLGKYQNGSDNVYGELNAPFSSDILMRRTKMTSQHVFVDLGSGVGNVVLQAALQVGCESWGCEMMDNASRLADEQHREFQARCRVWGLAPGAVHLERGDFRTNARIHAALKRADVVLVNNQAFTSQLNDDLVRMFLDLKAGCRIVSLKSFVHEHKGSSHNVNDVGSTILDVEDFTYPEGYVSWTGAGGTYCVSTRR